MPAPVPAGNRHADILDPDVYVHGVPHAAFQRLRDEAPVSWWDEAGGRGLWAVTRYDDVVAVSRQPAIFSSAQGIRIEDMAPDELAARRTMMELDPPAHTTYRRLVQPPFSFREMASYEEALRLMARAAIADLRPHTTFDVVERLARQVPMRMLGRLLGVPDDDGPWLVQKGDALIGNADPDFTDTPVGLADTEAYRLLPFRSPVSLELFAYAAEQARQRRERPTDDVISLLLRPTRDGTPLSDEEFKNFFTLLVAAGNDTTRYSIAAGLLALIEHPEQLAALRDDPTLMPDAVEEMLRWSTVTMHFRRTATTDATLGGRTIRRGDKVLIWFIAGDFDERRFRDPFRFDIRRTRNEHLAFGLKSPHKCLGEHLARLEMRVLFEELLPALADIRVSGPIARLRSNFIAGIKRLPVTVAWA
ncbi:MAG: cytochrome P450 [Vicinamibacterales bacterium]